MQRKKRSRSSPPKRSPALVDEIIKDDYDEANIITPHEPYDYYPLPSRRSNANNNHHNNNGGYEDPSYNAAKSSSTNFGHAPPSSSNKKTSTILPILCYILLWYLLGVVSIASSKILLSTHYVPPLVLTIQQLIIGMSFLRILLELQTSGDTEKDALFLRGVQPIPIQYRNGNIISDSMKAKSSPDKCIESGMFKRKQSNEYEIKNKQGVISSILALIDGSSSHHIHKQLFLAAIYFAMGFVFTNIGFQSGSAAFVETVKAAEPFTSASVAVLWGIERLGTEEVSSLIGIVIGVVLSTLGHGSSGNTTTTDSSDDPLQIPSPSQSLLTKCCIIMAANICFSFRGLHQKLFRSSPQGKASLIDDLNLQFRMQQIGVILLIIPTLLLQNAGWIMSAHQHFNNEGSSATKQVLYYLGLSLLNGLSFTSYNLASTYILTRISVVHHAALNCIRRVFAIIVTSLIFGLSITLLQLSGIALAIMCFFCYIHFKMIKETKNNKRKELRKKWAGIMP